MRNAQKQIVKLEVALATILCFRENPFVNAQKQIVVLEAALAIMLCANEDPYAERTKANRKVGSRSRNNL